MLISVIVLTPLQQMKRNRLVGSQVDLNCHTFAHANTSTCMKIENFIWLQDIIDKLAFKHHVEAIEVEEVFNNHPKIRFIQKGNRSREDVYMALGRSEAGRYLAVIFIIKKNNNALILSARDMAKKERRQYGRK